jgi:hypothetical protein
MAKIQLEVIVHMTTVKDLVPSPLHSTARHSTTQYRTPQHSSTVPVTTAEAGAPIDDVLGGLVLDLKVTLRPHALHDK